MAFDLSKCKRCGDCFYRCHYTDYGRSEAIDQMLNLISGRVTDIITACVTCVACNEYCQHGANPFDLLQWRQEKTDRYTTTASYLQLVEGIDQSPSEVIPGRPGRPVINVCAVDVIPNLFEGRLFEGCTFLMGGAFESALGWIHAGKETPLQNNLQQKIDALAQTGFTEIIMFHDDCYAAYTTKAMAYRMAVPFTVTHYVEYLRDSLQALRDQIVPLNIKIAYQRPCSSRYSPWLDEVLDELFSLCGVERVNRMYDRTNALCCGCPVSPHLGHQVGRGYLKRNIQDALDHGAEAMVFMCPFCAMQMRDEVADTGMTPVFLTNLARMALGESLSSHPAGLGDERNEIVAAVKIVKGLI